MTREHMPTVCVFAQSIIFGLSKTLTTSSGTASTVCGISVFLAASFRDASVSPWISSRPTKKPNASLRNLA